MTVENSINKESQTLGNLQGGKIMFNPFDIPELRYVGDISCEDVNDGAPMPLFEPVEPENRPSINTLEGCNKLAAEINRRSFVSANGRKPESEAELNAWVSCMCREAVAAV